VSVDTQNFANLFTLRHQVVVEFVHDSLSAENDGIGAILVNVCDSVTGKTADVVFVYGVHRSSIFDFARVRVWSEKGLEVTHQIEGQSKLFVECSKFHDTFFFVFGIGVINYLCLVLQAVFEMVLITLFRPKRMQTAVAYVSGSTCLVLPATRRDMLEINT